MKEAMKTTKLKTKKATVEAGLKELIRKEANEGMRSLRGKGWGWPEDK
jgi:Arc/MetJ family transcription regulator